ncbi:MAG: CpaD family pilus assembly protein [Sphingomonadaceae bacterium]|nr:CpaD family pilus assembly protein [Sphingomonadaceae bacterium]
MRTLATSTVLAVALTLGACNTPSNPGLTSVHQPVVSRTDYVFDVSASGDGMSPGEMMRVNDWFNAIELGYGDRVSIDDPNPYGGAARRAAVAELAARHGMLLADVAPITAGQVRPGEMRVVVSRAVATVPGCPDWRRPSTPDFSASTTSNYGCGVNSNLAAMVANPEDLVRGQRGALGGDARTTTRAIEAYRNAEPTGSDDLEAPATSESGGNN